tara:strand:+ start:880 stop:2154 length:1275 start_codon:yes stop_codon:yes gene_type:complete
MTNDLYKVGHRLGLDFLNSTTGSNIEVVPKNELTYEIFSDLANTVYQYLSFWYKDELESFASELFSINDVKQNYKILPNFHGDSFTRDAVKPITHWLFTMDDSSTQDHFKKSLDTMIELWSSPTYKLDLYAANFGFIPSPIWQSKKSHFGLGWNIANDEAVVKLLKSQDSPIPSNTVLGNSYKVNTVLKKTVTLNKNSEINITKYIHELELLLLSLRINNAEGAGTCGIIGLCPLDYIPIQKFKQFIQSTPSLVAFQGSLSLIDDKFHASLVKTTEHLNHLDNYCSFGLQRLAGILSRNDWTDQVVDLSIAMESLLSPKMEGELSHRLALRATYLLRNSSGDKCKDEIFRSMKQLYTMRSNIVHANNKLAKKISTLKPSAKEALEEWYQLSLKATESLAEMAYVNQITSETAINRVDTEIILNF